MILCDISEFHRYCSLHPAFPAVDDLIRNTDLARFPEGRTELKGSDLYISASLQGRTRPSPPLEAHHHYIDVQVILEGVDTLGWAPLSSCTHESVPYDAGKDVVFYSDAPVNLIRLQPGQLVVFFPEDAHAPLIGNGDAVRKLVVKVRTDWHPAV